VTPEHVPPGSSSAPPGSDGSAVRVPLDGAPTWWASIAVVLLAACLGLWLRTAGLDADTLLGTDPYVHLRHLEASVAHWPAVQRYDVGTAFPDGQRSQVAGLLHLLLAVPCLLLQVEPVVVLAWMPVVCFLGTLLLVAVGAWRVSGPAGGALAAATLVAWPGEHLQRTLLGAGDHHAVEALLVTALTVACGLAAGRARVAALVVVGWAFPLVWVGAPLALALGGLGWWAAARDDLARADQRSVGVGWAVAGLLTALCWPTAVLRPDAHAAAVLIGLLVAWLATPLTATVRATGVGLGAALVWSAGGGAALHYLTPRDPTIMEQAVVTPERFWLALGCTAGVALLAWAAAKRTPQVDLAMLVAMAWVVAWVGLRDFGYQAAPALALAVGAALPTVSRPYALALGIALIAPWSLGVAPPWHGVADRAGLVVVDAPLREALGWLGAHEAPAVDVRACPGPGTSEAPAPAPAGARAVLAPWWFGHAVPTLSGHPVVWSHGIDPDGLRWLLGVGDAPPDAGCPRCEPDRGVGFVLITADLVADRFAGASRQAGWPPERWQVEEVAVEHDGQTRLLPIVGEQHDMARAVRLARSAGSGEGGLRLVWSSEQRARVGWWFGEDTLRRVRLPDGVETPAPGHAAWLGSGLVYRVDSFPAVLLFAVVAGARVRVRAPAGAMVEASLSLRVPGGRGEVPLRWSAVAGADGLAELRLPHATEGAGAVAIVGPYLVNAPGRAPMALAVSEAAVREGLTLHLGN
jgi:hypothetical protein